MWYIPFCKIPQRVHARIAVSSLFTTLGHWHQKGWKSMDISNNRTVKPVDILNITRYDLTLNHVNSQVTSMSMNTHVTQALHPLMHRKLSNIITCLSVFPGFDIIIPAFNRFIPVVGLGITQHGDKTHSRIDLNNTHSTMTNPINNTWLQQPQKQRHLRSSRFAQFLPLIFYRYNPFSQLPKLANWNTLKLDPSQMSRWIGNASPWYHKN